MGFPAFAFESLPPLATTNHSNAFVLAGRCGGGAIRTLDALRHAAFPRRCTRPLCDASVQRIYITPLTHSHPSESCYALLYWWMRREYPCDEFASVMSAEWV